MEETTEITSDTTESVKSYPQNVQQKEESSSSSINPLTANAPII